MTYTYYSIKLEKISSTPSEPFVFVVYTTEDDADKLARTIAQTGSVVATVALLE